MEDKFCKGCETTKLIDNFSSYHKRGVKYFRGLCKECDNKRTYQWKKDNPEKFKEQKKRYRLNNKEKVSEVQKNWRENNKKKVNEIKKRYKLNHGEKIAEDKKKYYKKAVSEIRDFYVLHLLEKTTKVDKNFLKTQEETIEIYREKIKIFRKLKEFKEKINK